MRVVGDVKCYHCGHISGQVEGTRTQRLVLNAFKPREGYQGTPPRPGQRIRCDRCGGPVFLEDLQAAPPPAEPIPFPSSQKRSRTAKSKGKAA